MQSLAFEMSSDESSDDESSYNAEEILYKPHLSEDDIDSLTDHLLTMTELDEIETVMSEWFSYRRVSESVIETLTNVVYPRVRFIFLDYPSVTKREKVFLLKQIVNYFPNVLLDVNQVLTKGFDFYDLEYADVVEILSFNNIPIPDPCDAFLQKEKEKESLKITQFLMGDHSKRSKMRFIEKKLPKSTYLLEKLTLVVKEGIDWYDFDYEDVTELLKRANMPMPKPGPLTLKKMKAREELEKKISAKIKKPPQSTAYVYNDDENVHQTEINESVLKSVQCLLKMEEMENSVTLDTKKHAAILYRIDDDDREYIFDDGSKFTLKILFGKIKQIICSHKCKEELEKRLDEELTEANGVCWTGIVSRLINVFSGFIPDISIEINNINNYVNFQLLQILSEDDIEKIGSGTLNFDVEKILGDQINNPQAVAYLQSLA